VLVLGRGHQVVPVVQVARDAQQRGSSFDESATSCSARISGTPARNRAASSRHTRLRDACRRFSLGRRQRASSGASSNAGVAGAVTAAPAPRARISTGTSPIVASSRATAIGELPPSWPLRSAPAVSRAR
jgi:hypothetical protein